MGYDAADDTVVMFGGADASDHRLSDTWIWNGAAWSFRTPATSPPAMSGAVMAYDKQAQGLVLFGAPVWLPPTAGSTWFWNGRDWKAVAANGPTFVPNATFLATDPSSGRPLLVIVATVSYWACPGPQVCTPPMPPQRAEYRTWLWDGASWQPQDAAPMPDQQLEGSAALVTDPRNGRLALFDYSSQRALPKGGWVTVGAIDDWTGNAWAPSEWLADPAPTNVSSPLISYPPANEVVLIAPAVEGLPTSAYVWNTTWSLANPMTDTAADVSLYPAVAYDARRREIVVFGGQPMGVNSTGATHPVSDETWTWNGADWRRRGGTPLPSPTPASR